MDVAQRPIQTAAPIVRSHRTGSYRIARGILLVMLATVVDVFNVLDRGFVGVFSFLERGDALRYGILLLPFAVALLVRLRIGSLVIRRPMVGDVLIAVLCLYGLLGSLFGAAFLGTQETARPVFLPMTLALFHLLALEGPTDEEVARILRWLTAISVLYVVMNFLVNTRILPGLLEYHQYRNANVAYVAMAIACAFVTRRWLRLGAIGAMVLAIFATYPSATTVLVLLVTGLTLFMTSPRATALRVVVVSGTVVLVAALAVTNFEAGVALSSRYFALVNKAQTSGGRLDLWSQGIDRFQESPLIGSAFTDEVVAIRSRDQRALPFHNDFLLFLAEGGLVGLGLLLSWIVITELTLLRWHRGYVAAGQRERALLVRVILVTLNAFFVSMAFNPVLPGLSRSATVFGLSSIAMSLGAPRQPRRGLESSTATAPAALPI